MDPVIPCTEQSDRRIKNRDQGSNNLQMPHENGRDKKIAYAFTDEPKNNVSLIFQDVKLER